MASLHFSDLCPGTIQASAKVTTDPNFKVAVLFEIKHLKNDARQSHSYYWMLTGSRMRSIKCCYFQSLGDGWVSCSCGSSNFDQL